MPTQRKYKSEGEEGRIADWSTLLVSLVGSVTTASQRVSRTFRVVWVGETFEAERRRRFVILSCNVDRRLLGLEMGELIASFMIVNGCHNLTINDRVNGVRASGVRGGISRVRGAPRTAQGGSPDRLDRPIAPVIG